MQPPVPRLTVLVSGTGTNLQALLDASTSSPNPSPSFLITHVISNFRSAYGLTRAHEWRSNHPQDAGMRISYHNLRAYRKEVDREAAEQTAATSGSDRQSETSRSKEEQEMLDAQKNIIARERYDADLASLILGRPPQYPPSTAAAIPPEHPAHPAHNTPPASNEDTHHPTVVVLAGFMHILSPAFLAPFSELGIPVLNLHPALPGMYDGANALSRAWQDWVQGARVVYPVLPEGYARNPHPRTSVTDRADDGDSVESDGEVERIELPHVEGGEARDTPPQRRRKITHTGAMVHHVISAVDKGTPVLVRRVDFRKGESFEDFANNRFRPDENRLMVDAVRCQLWGMGFGGAGLSHEGTADDEVEGDDREKNSWRLRVQALSEERAREYL